MSPEQLTTRASAVPFHDLGPTNAPHRDAILADIAALIDAAAFTNGPQVAEFEGAFAAYCDVAHCVGLASGLDALRLGLLAAGLEQGDEVLVPANTFIATFEAIVQAGGVPVPVDASAADYNIDPAAAEAAVTSHTRFILPVHLYGQMADMRSLLALAERCGLIVVEDACQAHGATRDGLGAGAAGLAGAFSFYPGKNLGAFGDAGALTTSDAVLADTVRALREHGQRAKYMHDMQGYTSRLDSIQAIVLRHKLTSLADATAQRRRAADRYRSMLESVGDVETLPVPAGSEPVWHLFPVRTEHRDGLAAHLSQRGVATSRHYPVPPHLSGAFSELGYGQGAFPVTESLAARLLSLPFFPGMSDEQIDAVVGAIEEFFDGR